MKTYFLIPGEIWLREDMTYDMVWAGIRLVKTHPGPSSDPVMVREGFRLHPPSNPVEPDQTLKTDIKSATDRSEETGNRRN